MITLINPPGIKSFSGLQMHTPNPPLGLAYIAGTLKQHGLAYTVIDGTGEALDRVSPYPDRADFLMQGLSFEEIVGRVDPESDIIGITCMFSTLWPLTKRLVERLKRRFPAATVVLGGEHGTAVYENVLKTSQCDVIVLGEGEETFLRLIEFLRSRADLKTVPGIAFRDGESVVATGLSPRNRDVDSIAQPDWESFPLEEYITRHQMNGVNMGRSMPILTTRGCPYRCSFCSNPQMWTRRWVPRDPKRVVAEMEGYVARYRVRNFDLQDLTAVINRRWIIDFCNEILDNGLRITWQMPSGTRAEVFDDEVAELLYRSGCRVLAFAPESGDRAILKVIRKQVDLEKMEQSVRSALRHGLNLSCFFVIGFPDDTPGSLANTLRLIRRLALLGVHDVSVSKFVPYPGSELFHRLQREGKLQLDDAFFVSPMDFYTTTAPSYSDHISTRRLYWSMIWMFTNFYIISFAARPLRFAKIIWKAVMHGEEQTRYAKWFVDRLYTRRRWRTLAESGARN